MMRSIGVGEVRPTDWNAAEEVGSGSTTVAVPIGCWQVTGGALPALVPLLALDAIEAFGSFDDVVMQPVSAIQLAAANSPHLFNIRAPITHSRPSVTLAQFLREP